MINKNINGNHFLIEIGNSNIFKRYTKMDKQIANRFIKLYLEYLKTNNIKFLKYAIKLSSDLSVRSAIFEQINIILFKEFLFIYNR